MTPDHSTLQQQEARRVRMRFADGHGVAALPLSATTGTDGREHLLYEAVEWTSRADTCGGDAGACCYADSRTPVSIGPAGEPLA